MHCYPIPQNREIAYIRVTTPTYVSNLVISGITMLLGSMPILYAKEAMIKSRMKEVRIITKSTGNINVTEVPRIIATPHNIVTIPKYMG